MSKKLKFSTCVFKLHNPSARRRKVLDHIFEQYTLTMDELLIWAKDNIQLLQQQGKYRLIDTETGEVKSEKYTEKSIAVLLPKPSNIKADIASCLKEALVKNIATMLASYLELDAGDKQEAGFPTCRDPSPDGYPNTLENLCSIGLDLEAENEARAILLKMSRSNVMPIYFSRSRDFALLTDINRQRFFAWLKLLPKTSPLVEPTNINQDNLVTVSQCNKLSPGDIFTYSGKSGLLFPVQIGWRKDNWHWQYKQFIRPALESKSFIKSAKLVKDNGDFFLHISFGFEIPKLYKPEAYLGIDRGVLYSVAYGLIDKNGSILETGHKDDPFRTIRIRAGKRIQAKQKRGIKIAKKDYKQRELDGILHRLVNDMLDLAKQHKAMLVFEDLNIITQGKFYRSAYEKLYKIAEYKAERFGIPIYNKGKGVWAAYSSLICIHCGGDIDRNDRIATCKDCGRIEHSDDAAGINIARRALYRAKEWGGGNGKSGNYRAFHRSFANKEDFRAEKDLRYKR